MEDWKLESAHDMGLPAMERHHSYQREGGLVSNVSRCLWWSMVWTLLKTVNRLEIHGKENLPEEPSFLLVANHASHLDALVLGAALPLRLRDRLFPLAAGDVFFETPALSMFSATVLNALPVWRKNCGAHAIKDLRQRLLDEPSVFILFPEGGRSRDGNMIDFKPGVGMMTAETPIPVVPCHIKGTFEAFPANSKRPRFGKISVHIGTPRVFEDLRNRRKGWNEVAETLQDDVRSLGGLTE